MSETEETALDLLLLAGVSTSTLAREKWQARFGY